MYLESWQTYSFKDIHAIQLTQKPYSTSITSARYNKHIVTVDHEILMRSFSLEETPDPVIHSWYFYRSSEAGQLLMAKSWTRRIGPVKSLSTRVMKIFDASFENAR